MDRYLLHSRQNNQQIRVQLFRKHRCCEVFVDYSRSALKMMPVCLENRDSSSAAGHNNVIRFHQRADRIDLDDALRFRTGHDPAPTASGVFHHVILTVPLQFPGFRFRHERTDRLGGIPECRILRIYFHLGQHGRRAFVDPAVQHFLPHSVLQIIADVSLAHRHADRQRARNILLRIRPGQLHHRVLDHPDLRSVSVADHDFMTVFNQVHNRLCCNLHSLHLFRQITAQSVPTQSNDNSLSHTQASKRQEAAGCENPVSLDIKYYFWKNRATPLSSRALSVACGSFTFARKIIAAMIYGLKLASL